MDQSWDEWLGSLDAGRRAEAESLLAVFRRLGDEEPELAVRSQISEGIPQLARFVLARDLWRIVDGWAKPGAIEEHPQAVRLLAAGGDRADIVFLARVAAFEAILEVVGRIDHGPRGDLADLLPGWALVELDAEFAPTKNILGELQREFVAADPSGNESQDLLWK